MRPSHPASNVRDDREAPLFIGHGMAGISNAVSSKQRSEIFFAERLDTGRKSLGMTCPVWGNAGAVREKSYQVMSNCFIGIIRSAHAPAPEQAFTARRSLQASAKWFSCRKHR